MDHDFIIIEGSNVDNLFTTALDLILKQGMEQSPRKMVTLELSPCLLKLQNPCNRILTNSGRHINPVFLIAEFIWILRSRNDLEWIERYNDSLVYFSEIDNSFSPGLGRIIKGAYGWRMRKHLGVTLGKGLTEVDQIEDVVNKLQADKYTRRAIISIWNPNMDVKEENRFSQPCNCFLQFLIRNDSLNLILTARSIDLLFGFPYDIFNFTLIQEIIADILQVKIGQFFYQIGSLHIYKENLNVVTDEMKNYISPNSDFINNTKINSLIDLVKIVKSFLLIENQLRTGNIEHLINNLSIDMEFDHDSCWYEFMQVFLNFYLNKEHKESSPFFQAMKLVWRELTKNFWEKGTLQVIK